MAQPQFKSIVPVVRNGIGLLLAGLLILVPAEGLARLIFLNRNEKTVVFTAIDY